jgi:RimJ/RimL family protein N-acetyltransferase
LLHHVIDWAGANGVTLLTLEVFEDNVAARSLYHKCGFRPDAVLPDRHLVGGRLVPIVIMSRRVPGATG